jgi:hypothetical protein
MINDVTLKQIAAVKATSAKGATSGYGATSGDPPRIAPCLKYAPIRQWRLYKTAHLWEKLDTIIFAREAEHRAKICWQMCRRWYIRYPRRSLWVLTRTSLCPRTDMLQRRNLRSRSVGDSRHAWSGALSRRSVVGYSGGLRMIGIGPEDDDAC